MSTPAFFRTDVKEREIAMRDEPKELAEAWKQLRHHPERCLEMCESYLRLHPDDPDGLFTRFHALDSLRKDERALADIDRLVELEPTFGYFHQRGLFLHRIGKYKQTVDDLTRARQMSEFEWRTSFGPHYRASALAHLGRFDEALEDCKFIPEDHWMPGVFGLPAGNKEDFIAEIKRRALAAR